MAMHAMGVRRPERMLVTVPHFAPLRSRVNQDRGLRGMGQSAAEYESESAWWNLVSKFRQASQQLAAAEDLFRRDPRGSGLDGRELIRLRNDLTALQSEFQYWWTSVMGAPANLGLGAVPLAAAGAVALIAAKLAVVAYGIYVISQIVAAYQANVQVQQTQATTQQNTAGSLLVIAQQHDALAAGALARGDQAAAQFHAQQAESLRAQAAGITQQGFGDWLEGNWTWVAALTAAVVLGPELIRKI